MKKIIVHAFIIVGCMITSYSLAQTGVQVKKKKYVLTYEPTSVLESGIDNAIHITVSDSTVKRLLVNSSQGIVKQKGEDFIVHPIRSGELLLRIYNYNDLSKPVLIDEKKMEVVAAPFATMGGKQGGKISKEELKLVTSVAVKGGESEMKITEFKLSVAGKGIKYREFSARDENLTEEMLAQLQHLPANSKIYIEYIRAGSGESTRQIAPLAFTVVE
ncbi:MAG: hypothetical protein ABI763_02160 [Bacteroidota bacterium]